MISEERIQELKELVSVVSERREKDGVDFVNNNLLQEVFNGKIEIEDYKEEQVPNRAKEGKKTTDIKLTIKINGEIRKGYASQLSGGYINDDNEFVPNEFTWKQILSAILNGQKIETEEKKWFGSKAKEAVGECPAKHFDYNGKQGLKRYKEGTTYIVTKLG
jgi:hypothetical protein